MKNIDTAGLVVDKQGLPQKTRVIAHSQHVIRIDRELAIPVNTVVENDIKIVWVPNSIPWMLFLYVTMPRAQLP